MTKRYATVALAVLLFVSLAATAPVAAASASTSATQTDCTFPFTTEDATGQNVTVEERPDSIVVLQPSAAQTVWELGAQDRVVGAPVNPFTAYLDGIESKEPALNDDQFSVNQEAVVNLSADIVLAPNVVPDETVNSLREANQTVFKFGFGTSLQFIADKTALTGRLIGSCDAAEATNEEYWNRIDAVRNQTGEYESPRAMYFTDNFTAGSGTFINELITTAGGTNVPAENGVQSYQAINDEALVEWNPEVIIVSSGTGGVPNTAAYESTFAVQNDQVVAVNGNYISQPGPRIALALEDIAAAFADAELESEKTATEDDGAGFGPAVAISALLGAALLARRL
ncbi:MAG: iron complex transport system substrate-binding protein [Natronomonas sp.]|jgi:iron complex transport system substrate-binding protein|uniref:PGF-CTERM-anchored ABC transporter substrate-binding protein n=1 Tax=Natronomonas sp. TaxID=2184060 RepID=UPI0039890A03